MSTPTMIDTLTEGGGRGGEGRHLAGGRHAGGVWRLRPVPGGRGVRRHALRHPDAGRHRRRGRDPGGQITLETIARLSREVDCIVNVRPGEPPERGGGLPVRYTD